MDKETFDKIVAGIWALYSASKTLNDAGIGNRATTENAQRVLRVKAAKIGEALATDLEAKPQAA